MTNTDKKAFAEMMMGLGLAYKESITEPLTDLYFKALTEMSIEDVRRAGAQILKTSKFFPRVADFYDYVHGDANEAAQRGWVLLVHTVERLGGYPSLMIRDAPFALALQTTFGDWVRCCEMLPLPSDPMFASFRKQFIENYRVAAKDQTAIPVYLSGRSEQANRLNCATFTRGMPAMDGEEPAITQRAGAIINGRLYELNLNFNITTGALTAQSRQFLQGGHLQLTEGT
jgi:hypothetical protein